MAEVKLERVSKTFPGGVAAVREVSLSAGEGELVVLVGPSGCGKTTTLRMIAGLEEATEGVIWIGGRVVNDLAPKDRDVAMVFQNYALYPHMSVYRNMAFALKMRRVPKADIDARVRRAAQTLGIVELLDRKPGSLSGGQRQRVAVGRAIVREPKAFLFDEPLSNLDARMRLTTRAELKALHQRLKTTTIYVTHDQEEAMTLGDRIVVMAAGSVQQVGAPLAVYQGPVNRFVASFIGMPPMNFVEGTVRVEGGTAVFVARQGAEGSGGLRLSPGAGAALRNHAGRDLVLGVRPQALSVAAGPTGVGVQARVDVVEPQGDQTDLFCTADGVGTVVARVGAGRHATGDRVTLAVDMERVHVFEAGEFGANLTLGGRGG